MKTTFVAVLACSALALGCGPEAADVTMDADLDTDQSALRIPQFELGSWNLEWFGSKVNGPTDEALQAQNVATVLGHLRPGLYGLCEVVSPAALKNVAGLLGYGALVSNDPEVALGAQFYSPSEQKVALLYQPAEVTITHAELILTDHANDFGGRPPLHVDLTLSSGVSLGVVVVHFKAFADADAYARRSRGADALDAWLGARPNDERLAVIGDWNDGLDRSIYAGHASPFAGLVAQTPALVFSTAPLDAQGLSSTVHGGAFIDHHLLTHALARGVTETAELVRADAWVEGYGQTTSDHYPVVTHLRRGQPRAVVNEVALGADGYVELYNPGSKPLKLDRWKIFDGERARFDFTTQTLAPHAVVVVPVALAASTQAITLEDDAFTMVDQVTFAPHTGTTSLQRENDGDANTALVPAARTPGTRLDGTPF